MVVWDRRNYIHVEEVRFYEQPEKSPQRQATSPMLCYSL